MLLVIVVAVVARLAGLAANRWPRPRPRPLNEDDDTGMAGKDLVGPLLTLTVLLLARIRADAVCYARAVRAQEWPAMADGQGSSAASVWSTDFRAAFGDLQASLSSACWSPAWP
ncbi:hypothetical protein [Streptomyces sp. NPDC001930]|uniref:hypothetical protein n=1 Tax=Streptomyces sp. NPDC001930 TaxID=3364625 RepID=UPI0036B718EF